LRTTPALRRMVAETTLEPWQLVLPLFVREGLDEPRPISSMPGVVQHTRASLLPAVAEAAELGLGGVMLFGIPETKDAVGSGATDPSGILNLAITDVVAEVGDALTVMSDLCLDEFTDHGHCGVLDAEGRVDNDRTLERYAEMALGREQPARRAVLHLRCAQPVHGRPIRGIPAAGAHVRPYRGTAH
jgi:porphobilinogen synthase